MADKEAATAAQTSPPSGEEPLAGVCVVQTEVEDDDLLDLDASLELDSLEVLESKIAF